MEIIDEDKNIITIDREHQKITIRTDYYHKYLHIIPPLLGILIVIPLYFYQKIQNPMDIHDYLIIMGIGLSIDGIILLFYRRFLWRIFKLLPVAYYSFSFAILTLIGFIPSYIVLVVVKSNHSIAIMNNSLDLFLLINFLRMIYFIISLQSTTTIEVIDHAVEAHYIETVMIFPFTIEKKMTLRPNADGQFRLLIAEMIKMASNILKLSHTVYVKNYSAEEFSEASDQHSYSLRLYDPETNPKIENAVIMYQATKSVILQFIEVLKEFGDIIVIKQEDKIFEIIEAEGLVRKDVAIKPMDLND